MPVTRRDFIKQTAIAATASVAGVSLPTDGQLRDGQRSHETEMVEGALPLLRHGLRRDRRGRTTRWWPPRATACEVNKGLNCVKGYFLSKIMYGQDRLTKPLLRMKNGKYDKNGEFAPVSWDRPSTIMESSSSACSRRRARPPSACSAPASGRLGRLRRLQAVKAGFRSNNIDPNARHCMASAVTGFMRTFGMDEPMGCYDDIEPPTPSCCGARTWPRCTRSCGPASPTAA
jgi:nitrate reductase NapA